MNVKLIGAAAFGVTMVAGSVNAGTVNATSVTGFLGDTATTCTVAAQNTDRTDICNSLGAPDVDGSFQEGGFTSTANYDRLEYTFGTAFKGPLTIWEVTGGGASNLSYVERLLISFLNSDTMMESAGQVLTNIEGEGDGPDRWKIVAEIDGIYDTVLVADGSDLNGGRDGFDIDALEVTAVPLPASAVLLLAGLGGLGMMRRKS